MKGYHNNPQANASSFTKDGFFRTGDQGVFDEEGFLFLTGRLKEMINRGGEKISPVMVDEALLGHPAVAIAVAFGVADEKYGEEVHAAIVLNPKYATQNKAEIEKQIREHCLRQIAAFAVPKKFYFVDDVPRTATGKIQRRIVSEHFAPQPPKTQAKL